MGQRFPVAVFILCCEGINTDSVIPSLWKGKSFCIMLFWALLLWLFPFRFFWEWLFFSFRMTATSFHWLHQPPLPNLTGVLGNWILQQPQRSARLSWSM